MKAVGMAGGLPRTKAGDFERAWELITAVNGDRAVKSYLAELRDAEAAATTARDAAVEAERRSKERDQVAVAAEAAAAAERQTLADETATASAALDKRTSAVTAREQAADAADRALTERAADVDKRIGLLREAGVVLAE